MTLLGNCGLENENCGLHGNWGLEKIISIEIINKKWNHR